MSSVKTKINIEPISKLEQFKQSAKKAFTGFLLVFIGSIYTWNYIEGVKAYEFIQEGLKHAEEAHEVIHSKSYSVTSAEPENSSQEGESKGNTVTLSDAEVAPEGRGEILPSITSNKQLIADKGKEVFGESEVHALIELVDRESDFNHLAQNPVSTAYGIFQFLNSTWETVGCEKTDNPEKQVECGLKYIQKRYGSPSKALAYHSQNNSY